MQITNRDIELFFKLSQAQWLSTSQIGRIFFPGKNQNAVNKRMRRLVLADYLFCKRKSSMEEYLFRLTNKSKQAIIDYFCIDSGKIIIPRKFPQNIKHFSAINDLRIYFELSVERAPGEMLLFATDRDLKRIYPFAKIVPDAIVRFQAENCHQSEIYNFLIEYDHGNENPGYFARHKICRYMRELQASGSILGLQGIKILIFADNLRRIISLMKCSMKYGPLRGIFYFSLMDSINKVSDLSNCIYLDPYDFFELVKANGKISVGEKQVSGAYKIQYYSLLILPVLQDYPDDRTGKDNITS